VIFVTVGTQLAPFDRLLRAVSSLSPGEELVVQYGTSKIRPSGARCFDFLPFDECLEHIRQARVVVAHAGVGTAMVALLNAKRPVVMPRLKELGEEDSDDHQREFARKLQDAGLGILVEDPADLKNAVVRAGESSVSTIGASPRLLADLRAYLLSVAGRETLTS
jgi:UDP-N-acetylglucosamine transferase subunit ALG13